MVSAKEQLFYLLVFSVLKFHCSASFKMLYILVMIATQLKGFNVEKNEIPNIFPLSGLHILCTLKISESHCIVLITDNIGVKHFLQPALTLVKYNFDGK